MRRPLAALLAVVSIACLSAASASAQTLPPKQASAVGRGGAAATVDPLGTQAAIDILRRGGNAVDATVAAAAMLGVTEPYSCGIGGGGFMVIYRAADRKVFTIDGREEAPAAFQPTSFLNPATGNPIPFAEGMTSGLGVGVPGTLRTWEEALRRYGTMPLSRLMAPAIRVAEQGFVVDQTFYEQTEANRERFDDFTTTRDVFLTAAGQSPPVGSVFRNPEMAATYRTVARRGVDSFYTGDIAEAIVQTVQSPPVVPGTTRNVRPGLMTLDDLRAYRAPHRPPAASMYRGLRHVGMRPPSSGASTVGEALNILEGYPLATLTRAQTLHYFLEASAFSFADRGRYLGDPDHVNVPLEGLLSDSFAAERRALIGPRAATKPVPPGDATDNEGPSTTHLTVADRWGNVVSYTFTIEATGGSGIVAGNTGFILNNELTDFEFTPGLANSPAGDKRPRSSMSPTIVLRNGRPEVAVGSPGGSMIITTVLQILVEHLDLGRPLPDAIAAPRASQRNTASVSAEPAFIASEGPALQALGHRFTSTAEIGAATGIDFQPGGVVLAAAEPVRRGGGDARALNQAPGRRCEVGTSRRALRAGATTFVRVTARLLGTPAARRRVAATGAGTSASGRTNVRGEVVLALRPRAAGLVTLRVAGTGCRATLRVRGAAAAAAGAAAALAGRGV